VTVPTGATTRTNTALLGALAGLTSLGVLLQGLWAGLFLPVGKGGNYDDTWVAVHSWGARITLLLALVTTVVAFVRHRSRRELWTGALVLTVLLVIESVLGAAISDGSSGTAAAFHVPLALLIMSLTVWLPLRARGARAADA
jgi:heme A synthase